MPSGSVYQVSQKVSLFDQQYNKSVSFNFQNVFYFRWSIPIGLDFKIKIAENCWDIPL